MGKRKQKVSSAQMGLLERQERTAPAVLAIRQEVDEWRQRLSRCDGNVTNAAELLVSYRP